VEVRVAGVCPDVDTTLLVATLSRTLVAAALIETRAGTPLPPTPRL
jgi:hypothetical protein